MDGASVGEGQNLENVVTLSVVPNVLLPGQVFNRGKDIISLRKSQNGT